MACHHRRVDSPDSDAVREGLIALSVGGNDASVAHFWGIATGALSSGDHQAVVEALRAHNDPATAPDLPWAALVVRPDGTVAASASTGFIGGLFWAWESSRRDRLLVAAAPGSIVRARTEPTHLSSAFVRAYVLLFPAPPATTTPYLEVNRIRPGTTAVWTAGHAEPRTIEWCGPSAWPTPHVEGPGTQERYLATFDATVDALVAEGEPLVATLSGGLDSSFTVASLVRHATPHSPVHAMCHSPHSAAKLQPIGNWDADDFTVAQAMERMYPGRVVVKRVVRPDDVFPLDVAESGAAAGWLPVFNAANQQWVSQISQYAASLGATRLFGGGAGNSSFSYGHDYAVRHYLRHASLPGLWGLVDPDGPSRLPTRQAVRSRLVDPVLAYGRVWFPKRGQNEPNYRELLGLGHEPPQRPRPMSRATYLTWLAQDSVLGEALAFPLFPAALADPYLSRAILDLAATMTPREWSRGPQPRGYARLLGEGRVPDEIRLRTRRGGQSWDHWYLIRNHRDRYYDEVASLPNTPILGGWVDHDVLRRTLDEWPWGEVQGPSQLSVIAMDRILSLATFVRLTTTRLNGLPT